MKFEHIVFAVAAKVDIDPAFVFEYVVCRHIQTLLLKRTALPTLAIDPDHHVYVDSRELQQCIDHAAHLFLSDLARAREIGEAAMARCQLTPAH